jgi:hypothetical protein
MAATPDESIGTATGTGLDIVAPLPSWPLKPPPQHWTAPPVVSAQVWYDPTVTALAFTQPPSQQKAPEAQLEIVPLHTPAPSQAPAVVAVPPEHTLHAVPEGQRSHAPALHLPSVPQLAEAVAAQSPRGSVLPSVALAQVPFAPPVRAAEQAWQAPAQAVSQQKPSTQEPLRHWSAAAHAAPFACLGAQVPPEQ